MHFDRPLRRQNRDGRIASAARAEHRRTESNLFHCYRVYLPLHSDLS